jgi:hypothetical protein
MITHVERFVGPIAIEVCYMWRKKELERGDIP